MNQRSEVSSLFFISRLIQFFIHIVSALFTFQLQLDESWLGWGPLGIIDACLIIICVIKSSAQLIERRKIIFHLLASDAEENRFAGGREWEGEDGERRKSQISFHVPFVRVISNNISSIETSENHSSKTFFSSSKRCEDEKSIFFLSSLALCSLVWPYVPSLQRETVLPNTYTARLNIYAASDAADVECFRGEGDCAA